MSTAARAAGHAVASSGLTKRFGAQTAVGGVDLAVPTGAVYGFLGPNGSGKTTTIRMLLGLIRPTAGTCELLGEPIPAATGTVLSRVGALVEAPAFHPHLSGRANLHRLDAADLRADPRTARTRVGEALERVGLAAAAGKRFRAYSLGMKQRLAIAAALLQPRDLLILDEPTNGLDPQGTREIRRLVGSLAADGTTVLISSHLLSEVEQVCDHVGIMSRGRLLAQDRIGTLLDSVGTQVRVVTPDPGRASAILKSLGFTGLTSVTESADAAASAGPASAPRVVVGEGDDDAAPAGPASVRSAVVTGRPPEREARPEDVVAALVGAGVRVREFRMTHASLEDVFVQLTGEGFDVSE
ncbi:MAG TPA: ATP-binding cassette domain-containing protein [Actinomycetales bacterium]|nr:ATP-binding cassette domain-containing protein [Actinomycetales bacterium]